MSADKVGVLSAAMSVEVDNTGASTGLNRPVATESKQKHQCIPLEAWKCFALHYSQDSPPHAGSETYLAF